MTLWSIVRYKKSKKFEKKRRKIIARKSEAVEKRERK